MSTCETGNDYNGNMGARISAIFVILIGSGIGAAFPTFAHRHQSVGVPPWVFFILKYFGSGVIIATAFIHLLSPANEALSNDCLTGPITDYDWVQGIALMTIFVMFVLELMTMRYAKFGHSHSHSHSHSHAHDNPPAVDAVTMQYADDPTGSAAAPAATATTADRHATRDASPSTTLDGPNDSNCPISPHIRGDDHLGHAREHFDVEKLVEHSPTPSAFDVIAATNGTPSTAGPERNGHNQTLQPESYAAQLTAVFILEFGVIFHSIFIGLTLAVAGSEFKTLYVVLVFHQTFEGLGLGTRLAAVPWPKSKRWTPYILAGAYALSTPIAIAIGLGVKNTYPPESQTTLIVNGVFDSISAGILIYTGLVELMAHEFMFSTYMQRAPIKVVLYALLAMATGAGLMALLGKWA